MKAIISAIGLIFSVAFTGCEQTPSQSSADEANYVVKFVQAPLVLSIVPFYEEMLGKDVIVGEELESATMTANTKQNLTRAEAIRFIEDSLLMHGFAVLPVDEGSVKLVSVSQKIGL